ncbi:cell division cycle protein 48-related / CDC48-like protein [Wolffia australiana]
MDSKAGESAERGIRTSDRLRQRRKRFGHAYLYYTPKPKKRSKPKRRADATRIAKLLRTRNQPSAPNPAATNLRRSTRKRKISINLEDYETDSSGTGDDDLMRPSFHSSKNKIANSLNQDELSPPRSRRNRLANSKPRREGLRPRRSSGEAKVQPNHELEDHDSSEEQGEQEDSENDNDLEEDGGDEAEDNGGDETEGDGGDEVEDGDDEDGEEEQDGRRRYDLRNRADVRRFASENDARQRARSPRRVLHHGMGSKGGRDLRRGGSRGFKKHRMSQVEDSDDSLLVDELDQGPAIPWARGNRSAMPWLFGGLDVHGNSSFGLNVAASGWGHHGDAVSALNAGVQTAGPSSKGGADIQPIQVDESISFDDIGGLSEYINALKEMVFFPLLYPDFFAHYHITPPRGVLLCGPPGTGKTLIARALACSAARAGRKVSFYMRKGADVLSKWVGEAERQLKLLFEEAQRNQPSIIFFDEIDGLAPVRSSKQEQIHNSIVSTLLALMDGLDSRGQVVLIGATNRIDAIDGALRRPGRFDREFSFPLPGCEARAEILDIHTRKWKEPPAKELKKELAASCVGYCGADLKALCTEAAIRAFREKYPQVYTSDDKFLIDVDSIRVEKYHFLEAMSTITPAAHRGSAVHSRPLSPVVAPCLKRHLEKIMRHLSDIFLSTSSVDTKNLHLFSYSSTVPLVYRPRLLICGDENVGLDHVGPAILHELEKFPVHSLGLPSLLSDPSAKTPEEALVHIFGEARRNTPSILFLPHYQLWWDTAHDQLKAVLLTLLEELPSNSPVLLLGTCAVPFAELDEDSASVFGQHSVYQVDSPNVEDISQFVDKLIEVVLSIAPETSVSGSGKPTSLPDLPKVPKEMMGPKISELRAKAEAEQHALRRLRMCLRDVCNRMLYDKRFTVFHYPVTDEDAPNYHSIIQTPMDIATILHQVDCGHYLTRSSFLRDVDLIVANAKAYNGDDYNGSRIVSRAYELRDAVQGMLCQMDPALVSFCDKIDEQGGPVHVPGDAGDWGILSEPVVQSAAVTRTSARLRNVQPELNLSQSYEALRRSKKNAESDQEAPEKTIEPDQSGEPECHSPRNSVEPIAPAATSDHGEDSVEAAEPLDPEKVSAVKNRMVEITHGYGVPQMEKLYARVLRGALAAAAAADEGKALLLAFLGEFAQDPSNF